MLPVLALHGFPDGPLTFAPLAPALAMAGFELHAPYLPGHGPGPALPPIRGATLEAALDAILRDAEARFGDTPFHLIGHDWGAILGYALAAHHPERVASFTALAIPPLTAPHRLALRHPSGLARFWYIALFQVPQLGERLVAEPRFIDTLVARWSPGWRMPEAQRHDLGSRYASPALARTVLTYYRALTARASWRLLAHAPKVPTLAVAGARDGCFPAAAFPTAVDAARALGGAPIELVTLPGVGHWLHQEDPATVLAHLLPWLRAWRVARPISP